MAAVLLATKRSRKEQKHTKKAERGTLASFRASVICGGFQYEWWGGGGGGGVDKEEKRVVQQKKRLTKIKMCGREWREGINARKSFLAKKQAGNAVVEGARSLERRRRSRRKQMTLS
jgi:hypothetical protein